MKLRQEIREIVLNPASHERDITDLLTLFNRWALEIVGEDESYDSNRGRFNTEEEALLSNETKYIIRQRIMEETKLWKNYIVRLQGRNQ